MKGYGAILLRITVGAIYLMQAYLALFVAAPRGTASFIAKMGLPAPSLLALAVIVIHGVGGALLVLGVWTRLAAAANVTVVLIGVLATYVREGVMLRGGLLDAATKRATEAGYEYIALLIAATLALALTGAGAAAPSRPR